MSKPAHSTMRPTEVDETILAAINRLGGYLTAGQLTRLLYPSCQDRDRYSQRRLARLEQGGYLLRLRALRRPQFGSVPHVFTLTHTGRRYLAGRGYPVEPYYRPAEEHAKAANYLFTEHTLAIIDVLIAAERLVRDAIRAGVGQIEMPVVWTERRLKREAVPVTVPAAAEGGSTRRTVVIPDAWFQLQIG